jgi:transposase-like protein
MLLAGPKEIIDKIKEDKADEEVTLDELDAALQAELDALKEMERLEREAERERRKACVVGVTFDSRSRDLFDKPDVKTPKIKGYYVPFGKWKRRPLRDPAIPLSWLQEVDRRMKALEGQGVGQW